MFTALCLLLLTDMKYDKDAEEAWRAEREASMRAEDSWMNLAGLFWLEEGSHRFGTGEDMDIVLPRHATVPFAGTLTVNGDGTVDYRMNRGQRAVMKEKTVNEGTLQVGDVLAHNNLRMILLERGDRLALRLRDLRTKTFTEFESLDFYSPRRKYFLEARFVPFEEPEEMQIATVVGTEITYYVPGRIEFTLDGQEMSLLPTLSSLDDERFWIMFKDQTAGRTTYGAGRFLYADRPNENNEMILNFNRAYNPPCAYSAYATCPLPPGENWLTVEIEAGERRYHDKDPVH